MRGRHGGRRRDGGAGERRARDAAVRDRGLAGGAAGGPVPPRARLTAWVDGRVQGVGFRWWVCARALALGLAGRATNLPDGRVEIVAEGARPALAQLLAMLKGPDAPGRVTGVTVQWDVARCDGPAGFVAQ